MSLPKFPDKYDMNVATDNVINWWTLGSKTLIKTVSKRVGLGLMKINKKRFLIKLDGTFFIKTYYNNLKHYKRLFSMKSWLWFEQWLAWRGHLSQWFSTFFGSSPGVMFIEIFCPCKYLFCGDLSRQRILFMA